MHQKILDSGNGSSTHRSSGDGKGTSTADGGTSNDDNDLTMMIAGPGWDNGGDADGDDDGGSSIAATTIVSIIR